MWFSCAFLKTYGNPVPFPLGAHCIYILPCNALMSLRAEKRGPQKILLYFWGKGVCKHKTGNCRLRRLTGQKRSIRRVAISRKGNRIIKPTQDTFVLAWRKKAHTSKRVSIAASDNAISKVQCAPWAAPLTSRPLTSILYRERVRSMGQRTQP